MGLHAAKIKSRCKELVTWIRKPHIGAPILCNDPYIEIKKETNIHLVFEIQPRLQCDVIIK
jgi:hypothetical protein